MKRLEAGQAVLHAQDSATGAGRTRLQPPLYFSTKIKLFGAQKRRTCRCGRGSFGEAFCGENWGVDSVHTLHLGLGRTAAGLGRIAEVSGGVADIKGWNPVRVPPRAQCFPCSGACEPLSVHKLFTYGPLWSPFLLVEVVVARRLLLLVRAAVLLFTRSWLGAPGTA